MIRWFSSHKEMSETYQDNPIEKKWTAISWLIFRDTGNKLLLARWREEDEEDEESRDRDEYQRGSNEAGVLLSRRLIPDRWSPISTCDPVAFTLSLSLLPIPPLHLLHLLHLHLLLLLLLLSPQKVPINPASESIPRPFGSTNLRHSIRFNWIDRRTMKFYLFGLLNACIWRGRGVTINQ